jgi:hypothetical protein
MRITDGRGSSSGGVMGVNSEDRAMTSAVTQRIAHHTNMHEQEAYCITFEVAATGNDDCIFYLQNTSSDIMIISTFQLYVSQASEIYMQLDATGTPGGSPTTNTPVNTTAGSGHTADGTFLTDPDITGLSGGTEVARWKFIAETASQEFSFDSDLMIPDNQTFTMWIDTAATNIIANIQIYYHQSTNE